MKITRKESEFQPVVITLETQGEVDIIGDLLSIAENNSNMSGNSELWNVIHGMSSQMEDFVSDTCDLVIFDVPETRLELK